MHSISADVTGVGAEAGLYLSVVGLAYARSRWLGNYDLNCIAKVCYLLALTS